MIDLLELRNDETRRDKTERKRSALFASTFARNPPTSTHLVHLPDLGLPRVDPAIEDGPSALLDAILMRLRPLLERFGDSLSESLSDVGLDLALKLGLGCRHERREKKERREQCMRGRGREGR